MFLKKIWYAHPSYIYLIKNTEKNCNIVNNGNIEILLHAWIYLSAAQATFLIIINVENNCAPYSSFQLLTHRIFTCHTISETQTAEPHTKSAKPYINYWP